MKISAIQIIDMVRNDGVSNRQAIVDVLSDSSTLAAMGLTNANQAEVEQAIAIITKGITVEAGPFSVSVYYAENDGVPVVHIDTDDMAENQDGPICRVYLNEGDLFANPEYNA